jgi:anti-anti-sigma factor
MTTVTATLEKSLTLRVPGDLLSTTADPVRTQLNSLLESAERSGTNWTVFNLDLGAALMVDSVGLNLVVTLLKRVQKHGAKLRIHYSNASVARIFTFTRLDQYVELNKVG